jgi:hypothetical protein
LLHRLAHRISLTAIASFSVLALASLSAQANAAPSGAGGVAAPRAPAYTRTLGHFKAKYTKKWTWKTHKLGLCIEFTATGEITYTTTYTVVGHAAQVTWTKQKLSGPTLREETFNISCKRHVRPAEVDISQSWTGYSCSFNPSLGFSVPWGISVSGWPGCSSQKSQAVYATKYPPPGTRRSWHWTQYNSGSPTGFGDYTDPVTGVGLLNPPPCYGVYPSATVYYRDSSDSYGAGNLHTPGKVCLTKYE